MSWPDYIMKAAKGWEGHEPFWVWQIQSIKTPTDFFRTKKYLVVDARPQTAGVRFVEEKPEGLKSTGSIQGLIRKYAKSPAIGHVMVIHHHIWMPLYVEPGKPPSFWLVVAKKKPPELAFLNSEYECLVARSNVGTFTKKRRYDLDPPLAEEGSSLMPTLLAGYDDTKNSNKEPIAAAAANFSTEQPSALPAFQRQARDKLSRRLKTVRKSLAKQKDDIPDSRNILDAEQNARLLQQFLYRVHLGDFELKLSPEETGLSAPLVIALDPDTSAGENLENAFVRLKKSRKARETGILRLAKIEQNAAEMARDLETLRAATLSEHDVQSILVRHKLSSGSVIRRKATEQIASPYRRYHLPEGFDVLVGKSANDNDEMTKKAKSNDLWLHIVGPPGSHIVVQTKGNTAIPQTVINKAAILAIHYSKLRSDMAGEVYVTPKRNIKKKKGLPPGKWIVESAETIFMRFSESELKDVLDCLYSQI